MLPGHSSKRTALGSLLPAAASDFIGFLTAAVQEPDAAQNVAVAAQLTLIGRADLAGTSVDQELEMPMMGSHLKAVVAGPSALLAIQNSGMEAAQVTVNCIHSGIKSETQFTLPGNTLQLLRGCEAIGGDENSASHVFTASSFDVDAAAADLSPDPVAFDIQAGTAALAAFGLSSPSKRNDKIGSAIFINEPNNGAGITFTAGPLTVPSGFQSGGKYEHIQIMNKFREQSQSFQGTWEHINLDNIAYLDGQYPYEGQGPWTSYLSAVSTDEPGSPLDNIPEVNYYRDATKSGTTWSLAAPGPDNGWAASSSQWNGELIWCGNSSQALTAPWQPGILPQ